MQTWASVEHGYWYARSAEFLQTDLMSRLRWMRMFGDTIFAVGAITYVLFVFGCRPGSPTGQNARKARISIQPTRPYPEPRPRESSGRSRAHQIDRIIVSSILNRLGAATACG
jgi:hypothetical protein